MLGCASTDDVTPDRVYVFINSHSNSMQASMEILSNSKLLLNNLLAFFIYFKNELTTKFKYGLYQDKANLVNY